MSLDAYAISKFNRLLLTCYSKYVNVNLGNGNTLSREYGMFFRALPGQEFDKWAKDEYSLLQVTIRGRDEQSDFVLDRPSGLCTWLSRQECWCFGVTDGKKYRLINNHALGLANLIPAENVDFNDYHD